MKKIYLLSVCFALAHWADAQQKMEFGLVAKAGNFTLPAERTTVNVHENSARKTVSRNQPGSAYFLGVWQSLRLGNRFRLSAELLYRHTTLRTQQYRFNRSGMGVALSETEHWSTRQVAENSLFLPLKLHFSFKKNGRTSLAVGAGFSKAFGASYHEHQKSRNKYQPGLDFDSDQNFDLNGIKASYTYLTFTSGVYHRLDARTSIGLEFNFERRDDTSFYYYHTSYSSFFDCLCYEYPLGVHTMRNFSLSVSHSLAGIR
jgi:hypothetical protein